MFALLMRRSAVAGVNRLRAQIAAAAATAVVLTALPVSVGGTSLWWIPLRIVPGAVGIRAIGRLHLIAGLFAVVCIALAIHLVAQVAIPQVWRARVRAGFAIGLAAVCVEQVNLADGARIDRSNEVDRLAATPDPPANCAAFVVQQQPGSTALFWQPNVDAMMIAEHLDLPTLNGYSGLFPRGWALDPAAADYRESVVTWITISGADPDTICWYDLTNQVWGETVTP